MGVPPPPRDTNTWGITYPESFFVGWCWWGWKWVFRLRYEWTELWQKWRWFPCSDSKLRVLLFGLELFMVVQISDPRSRLWIASWLASAQMGFLTLLSLIWIICFSHLLGRTSISAIMSRVNKGIIYLLLLLSRNTGVCLKHFTDKHVT